MSNMHGLRLMLNKKVMGNGKFNIQSTFANKQIEDKKGYRALYTDRGVITSEDGNADYFRQLQRDKNKGKKKKTKYIALYAMGDGTVSYQKNNREVIKTGKAGDRLARRKDKKMDRIEKRFK